MPELDGVYRDYFGQLVRHCSEHLRFQLLSDRTGKTGTEKLKSRKKKKLRRFPCVGKRSEARRQVASGVRHAQDRGDKVHLQLYRLTDVPDCLLKQS